MTYNKAKRLLLAIISYALLVGLVLFTVLPLVWVVATSAKPSTEIFTIPPRMFTTQPTAGHYQHVLFHTDIPSYFVNSVMVGLLVTLLALVFGVSAGYGFARFRFKGNHTMSLFMLFSQMLPLTVIMIPVYLLLVRIGLLDSKLGLALSHLILALPVATWMSRSYFMSIPREIEEAALIDGCSYPGMLVRVVLPVAAPGIAATGIYAFIMSYNEFVLASVLTLTNRSRTLPIGLSEFSNNFYVDWGGVMAAAIIVSVPVILFFLFLQRYFVQGLSAGSVKG